MIADISFNPRSREGNDTESLTRDMRTAQVSIHVPARGTTADQGSGCIAGDVSIHVPARGTTDANNVVDGDGNVSIHVPARGTTGLFRSDS